MSEGVISNEATMPPKNTKMEPSPELDPVLSSSASRVIEANEVNKIPAEEASLLAKSSSLRSPLDEVLLEALRVPRDRIFILRQEKDIEDRIRSGQEQSWELPLMNSYQRLLVHRIADHFHLAHSIDATTKAVTLSRQADTGIPDLSLSSMAMVDMERLSEPAYAIPKEVGGLSGSFKIMRREGAGRSESPRNGQLQGEDGLTRDRRNMTIEEREAAYKEARLRIFGNEESSTSGTSETSSMSAPFGDIDTKSFSNLSLDIAESSKSSSLKNDSRKGTPGRVSPAPSSASSTSSAALLRAGAASFDPSTRFTPVEAQWQQPYPYPMMDMNPQPYYYYHPGGYGMPMLQHDMNGRQIIANSGPVFLTPPYAYPNQDMYSSGGPSPSISSRSTSAGGETEADGVGLTPQMASSSRNISVNSGYGSRPQSLSPTTSFQRGGSSTGGNIPHVYQGQVPVPASWNTQPIQSNQGRSLQAPSITSSNDGGSGRGGQMSQQMGYSAAVTGQGRSNLASSSRSSLSSVQSNTGILGSQSEVGVVEQNGQDTDPNGYNSRGRLNQSERSLFDPSKPSNGAASGSSSSTSRQSLGKSMSAGVLEGESTPIDQKLIMSLNGNLPVLNSELNRRVSSSSSSNNSSADASRKATPPSHPSLPARPDWVLQQKSRVSQLSNSSAGESNSANSS